MDIAPQSFWQLLFHKWQLKLLALVGAVIIWLCVNQTITTTKTLVKVPVRLVNVPPERSVDGMLPNGVLKKRIALTLTGAKDAIESLEDSDLEIVIDVSQFPEQSIVQASKKNLVSLDPRLDVRNITQVESTDLTIQLNKLVTEEIPISMAPPVGSPPEPYQFLDIWPQAFYQTVTASEKDLKELKEKGLKFVIDLSRVTKADLDALSGSSEAFRGDEVIFPVPAEWKKVINPCKETEELTMNDPLQKELVVRFLRQELVPLGVGVPVEAYYPIIHSKQMNPDRTPIVVEGTSFLQEEGMTILSAPLLAGHVSRWFIDVVRDRMSIVIVVDPLKKDQPLLWSVEIANLAQLEDAFVHFLMNDHQTSRKEWMGDPKKRESRLRRRFRQYVRAVQLYHANGRSLQLDCRLLSTQEGKSKVVIRDVSGL